MTKRRRKPHDPAEAARRAAERAENAAEIARLKAQPGVTVNVDPRTGKLVGALRMNCFAALLPADGPEIKAVDWLETILRTAQGENAQERRPDHIRAPTEGAPGQNITADMIAASEILCAVEENLYPAAMRLLFGLLRPDAALDGNWRQVVKAATGETNPQAQGAVVRASAANLLWIVQNIDRLVMERTRRRREAA